MTVREEHDLTAPEQAAWAVAVARQLPITGSDVRALLAAAEKAMPRDLAWHRGKHGWQAHDGYPRHAHSLNGVLTIDPRNPSPHFAFGPAFPVREETCPHPDT